MAAKPNQQSQLPIENLIHVIRGQQVMLDSDLARLYGVETKYLKRAVKSNINRFPPDFMFELDRDEFNNLRCSFCTSNTEAVRGGTKQIEGFFFEGQIFDAYTLISDLVRTANNRIVLIDNYIDDKVLKVLDKRKECVSATIYTNPKHSHISIDLKKHNAQYAPIEVKSCVNVHDRFLITDDTVYFIGGSIKDLGKKIVAFSRMHQNPDDIITRLR